MVMLNVTIDAAKKLRDILNSKFDNMGLGFRVVLIQNSSKEPVVYLKLDTILQHDQVVQTDHVKLILDPSLTEKLQNYQLQLSDENKNCFCLKALDSP
jgi:Fe-S cluster assembly iron-binding protein IscA